MHHWREARAFKSGGKDVLVEVKNPDDPSHVD